MGNHRLASEIDQVHGDLRVRKMLVCEVRKVQNVLVLEQLAAVIKAVLDSEVILASIA